MKWFVWAAAGAALICGTLTAGAVWAEVRSWTDASGKFRVEAEMVDYAGGVVKLKTAEGRIVEVPRERLSAPDKQYLAAEMRRRRNAVKATATDAATTSTTATSTAAATHDWPQWRGPNRDGISTEQGLLTEWPESGPPLAWQAKGLGKGYSSVVVADGRIFTMGNRDGGAHLIALAQKDGHELWATKVGGGDPNCTPTVDGPLVFALGRDGDLVCCKTASGEEVWRKNFGRDFGGKMMSGWGYSESPLVDGEKLVFTPGGKEAMIVALNKQTGETIWKAPMPETGGKGQDGAGYSSIVVSEAGGVRQYVQLVGRGVVGVDAKDGRMLWGYNRVANGTANIPTPIVTGDYVFCSSGYDDGGSALLRLRRSGSSITAEEIYYKRSKDMQNHHGGMILLDGHLYLGHGHNNGLPMCVDLPTGEVAWAPGRGPGSGSAAIAMADGHLYFRYQNGTMALIEANPSGYKLKGQFKIASLHGKSWPHPVIADGKLYLRDQHELHCYDITKK